MFICIVVMNRKAVYDFSNDKPTATGTIQAGVPSSSSGGPKNDNNIENIELITEVEDTPELNDEYYGNLEHQDFVEQEYGILDKEFCYENLANSKNRTISRFATFQSLHQIGIYGWKRTTIYILIVFIVSMTILNLLITVWILMQFNNDFNNIRLSNGNRIIITKDVRFKNGLFTDNILSDSGLKIKSKINDSLKLFSENSLLEIKPGKIVATVDTFEVRNGRSKSLPMMTLRSAVNGTDKEVEFVVQRLKLNDTNSLRIPKTLETRKIDSGISPGLAIRSPTSNVTIASFTGTYIESKLGPVSLISYNNLRLHSNNGPVTLESPSGIYLRIPSVFPREYHTDPKLKTLNVLQKLRKPNVYQLCVCDNGKLFAVLPRNPCSILSHTECH